MRQTTTYCLSQRTQNEQLLQKLLAERKWTYLFFQATSMEPLYFVQIEDKKRQIQSEKGTKYLE